MPKREVVISSHAQEQLQSLLDRLRAWGVRAFGGSEGADLYVCRLLDELDDVLSRLATQPDMYPLVLDAGLAELGYRRFLVRKQIVGIFRVDGNTVKIRGFFDARADYQRTLALELRQ